MSHVINPDTCVACGACQAECPSGAIKEGDVYSIDPDICVDCGTCADACPTGSISAE
ncbi:MAG: 4Fe-4S binding protein [Bacteroidales bacterium]|nr:4Fe-4S binding protein [Bacteroidales bacterium]